MSGVIDVGSTIAFRRYCKMSLSVFCYALLSSLTSAFSFSVKVKAFLISSVSFPAAIWPTSQSSITFGNLPDSSSASPYASKMVVSGVIIRDYLSHTMALVLPMILRGTFPLPCLGQDYPCRAIAFHTGFGVQTQLVCGQRIGVFRGVFSSMVTGVGDFFYHRRSDCATSLLQSWGASSFFRCHI